MAAGCSFQIFKLLANNILRGHAGNWKGNRAPAPSMGNG